MRSITTKAICTILLTAMVLGLAYFAITAPQNAGIFHPTTGDVTTTATTPTTPTVPTVPTTTVHNHLYIPGYHSNSDFHWTQCVCGEKSNPIVHTDSNHDGACDDCGHAVELPHQHSFSQVWQTNETNHWRVCQCGQATDIALHADTDLNGKCDTCDADVPLPPHRHSFGEAWQSDEENHWQQCDCGETANTAAHADEDVNGACDTCGYAMELPHEHSFGEAWQSDEENHWQQCECGKTASTAAHADEDVNGACDTCGYAMEIPHQHSFGEAWLSDEENHWQQCDCGEIANTAPHADEDVNGKCDVCNADIPLPPHQHSFDTAWKFDEANHWQRCDCGETTNTAAHVDANRNGKCDVCSFAVAVPDPPALPTLNGQHAFIFDCDKNAYLYRCEETHNTPIYPASITKLFTCYVALQYLKDINEEILLGDEQTLYPADASRAFFEAGETISVNVLLHGALMPSGSDATYALAAAAGKKILNDPNATGKDAVAAFMTEMNSWAQKLGMGNTHFVTPDGYHDDQHYVSFHAFITIARCAMGNPHILSICGKAQETVTYKNTSGVTIKHILNNSNKLLSSSNSCYIAEAVGLKTGTTDEAGCCFLGVFIHNGKAVIIGIFGCSTDANRWKDVQALWEYYLELNAWLSE